MDTSKKIHIELLRRLKIFSKNYTPKKSHKNHKKTNYNRSPIIYPKRSLFQEFPLEDKKYLVLSSYHPKHILNSSISQLKNNHKKHSISKPKNDFDHKNDRYKPKDKVIKINLVNQKFKIADNFNEKNSNQFLNEKDECLKKLILTDEIEEEELTPPFVKNEKKSRHKLSYIKKIEYSERDDSTKVLSELIAELK